MEPEEFNLVVASLADNAGLLRLRAKLTRLWDTSSCRGTSDDKPSCSSFVTSTLLAKITGLVLQNACASGDSRGLECTNADDLTQLMRSTTSFIAGTLDGTRVPYTTDDPSSVEVTKLVPLVASVAAYNSTTDIEWTLETLHDATCCFLQHGLYERFEPSSALMNLCFACASVLVEFVTVPLNKIQDLLLRALSLGKRAMTAHVLTDYIPKLATCRPEEFRSFLEAVVSVVRSFFGLSEIGYLVEKKMEGYSILSSIVQYLLAGMEAEDQPRSVVRDDFFWLIVQGGLVHKDSLTRRRSMYIVRHVLDACCRLRAPLHTSLFSWDSRRNQQLLDTWQNLFVVLEVLEDKQAHIVKPVLAKFAHFLQCYEESPSVHVSWVLLLLQRMLTHDSRTVNKWALSKFTASRALVGLTFESNMEKFIFGPLVESLNDPGIFAREDSDPLSSPVLVSKSLESFYKLCFDLLSPTDKFGAFLLRLFAALSAQSWNGVSLLYVGRALLVLGRLPVLNDDALRNVGEMLVNVQHFQEPVLRAAAQGYLLSACLHLLNPRKVTFLALSSFLGLFKKEEVLMRGTAHWNVVVNILRNLLTSADVESSLGLLDAASFLTVSLKNILESQSFGDTDLPCIHRVARMAILLHDAGLMRDSFTWSDLLKDCVSTLGTANSRSYLPLHRSLQVAEFLVALHKEAGSRDGGDTLQLELLSQLVPHADGIHDYVYKQAFSPVSSLDDFEASTKFYKLLDILSTHNEFNAPFYRLINEGISLCRDTLLLSNEVVSLTTLPRWRFLRWVLSHFSSKVEQVSALLLEIVAKGSVGRPLARPSSWVVT